MTMDFTDLPSELKRKTERRVNHVEKEKNKELYVFSLERDRSVE